MAQVPSVPGLVVRPVDNARDLNRVRRLHAECYLATGYVTDDDLSEDGYIDDDWIPYSDYYAAYDELEDNEIVGTCRIIRPSVRGFPAFEDTSPDLAALDTFAGLDPNRCIEISALATPRLGMQNMAISAVLYGAVWQRAILEDRAYMLAVMDNRLLRIMRRWFEFPFEAIGPELDYMGSMCTPVSMYVPRTIEVLAATNPDTLTFFSGDIPLARLDQVAIDLRGSVPEHRPNVVDLRDVRRA
ncbi:MAG: hypothetical protein AAF548_08775 [Actinomycetota bacterium]